MLEDIVKEYIKQPYPLWECEVTEALILNKWEELRNEGMQSWSDYSTARCITNHTVPLSTKFLLYKGAFPDELVYLEAPSFNCLQTFYDEHGLVPLSVNEIERTEALLKLGRAIAVIALVKPALLSIRKLVRAIQVLKQENEEIDIGYSHPQIPFTIFVSTCSDNSITSSLRVAESILHEAMHLKLTLLEKWITLVKPNSLSLTYSPWRDEERPVKGVLHGLFVFRAVYEFYSEIINSSPKLKATTEFLSYRLEDIKFEISSLKDLDTNQGLTKEGQRFVSKLIEFPFV